MSSNVGSITVSYMMNLFVTVNSDFSIKIREYVFVKDNSNSLSRMIPKYVKSILPLFSIN